MSWAEMPGASQMLQTNVPSSLAGDKTKATLGLVGSC